MLANAHLSEPRSDRRHSCVLRTVDRHRGNSPLRTTDLDSLSRSLAVVHGELVLIHPFRDGNGRCARLLATLMALQAGLPPLDFGNLEGRGRRRYFAAIGAVLAGEYESLSALFRATIERSLRAAAVPSRR